VEPGAKHQVLNTVAMVQDLVPSMPKLRSLAPLVRARDTSTTPLLPKVKEQVYTTPQFRTWRAAVVGRAGGRCEAIDKYGHRCTNEQPHHRMYADHIVELKDNGSLFDITNGQCLCASHHTLKTIEARACRLKG
jgi:5-methylcytosine-specific restriction enzyme A